MPKMQRSPPALATPGTSLNRSSQPKSSSTPSQPDNNPYVNVQSRKNRGRNNSNSPPEHESTLGAGMLDQIGNLIEDKLSPSSSFMVNLLESLKSDFKKMISTLIAAAIQENKDDFTKTTDFLAAEHQDSVVKILNSEKKIEALENDNADLQAELQRLNTRLSTLEKISRDHNLEIQAVPEHRGENLVDLFKNLCHSIDATISDGDIHACRRVAKANATSSNPRNILVSLTTTRLRDTVLSAVHRFNKANPKNMLNGGHIGLTEGKDAGTEIFVREHLSPETKVLHATARKFKKDNGYKYCWVRNGQVYLRKSADANHVHVKNLDVLNKLN